MIKLIKLMPSEILAKEKELAKIDKFGRNKVKEIEEKEPILVKKANRISIYYWEMVLKDDNIVGNPIEPEFCDNFISSDTQKMIHSKVDFHVSICESCQNGEYCESLGEILAA